jgi:NAD(P)-dependent dehydrogenase (short-subunit alcohol dehydrogenase family)
MPLDEFRCVIEVNLIGRFNVCCSLRPGMSRFDPLDEGERGFIFSTTSVAAFAGQISQATDSASKAGIVDLTLSATRELAR